MIPALVAGGIMAAGAIGNYLNEREKNNNTKRMYDDMRDMAGNVEDLNRSDISAYRRFMEQQYGGDAARYSGALQDYMNSPSFTNEGFQYTGDVADYMDPAANQRVAAAMNALESSAASGGNRFSSDYVNAQAAKQQALASDEWKNAYDRLTQARQQQLSAWQANSQNNLNMYNAANDRAMYGIGQYGAAKDTMSQAYGDALSAGMQNRTAGLQSQANAMAQAQSAANQQQSFLGQLAGPAAQFLGSYYGGS